MNFLQKTAFTLAEVLITIGIIGVVAAFTIPVLVHDIQDNQFKTAYKKAYSVASQAWQSAYSDNAMEPRSGWVSDVSNYDNFVQFMSKFDIVKQCPNTRLSDCWAPNETTSAWFNIPFNNASLSTEVCFIDKSGIAWCNANTWGYMVLDTNGFQKPNQYGLDRFVIREIVHGGDVTTAGTPNYLMPNADFTSKDDSYCPSGDKHPCYFTKWLYN